MNMSLDLLLRRSALMQAPIVPDIQEIVAWAELCFAQGEADVSRLLYEIAFVREGFSSRHRSSRAEVFARTGLWHSSIKPCHFVSPRGEVVANALEELRSLAAYVPVGINREPHPRSIDDRRPHDLGDLIHELYEALAGESPDLPDSDVDTLLLLLNESVKAFSADYRTFGAAPLPLLASTIALAGLRAFLLENFDLAFAPSGSAALLRATATLAFEGLGPYLQNVPRIVRGSRDIFQLVHTAKDAACKGGDAQTTVLPWLILLTSRIRGGLLIEIVDDLADIGAMDVLAGIYERIIRELPERIDQSLVSRLRDSALDNLDYDFAARAQALIVRLYPDALQERVILGTIEGSGGLVAAAEQTFLACMNLAPDDEEIDDRLVALRRGAFAPYAIDRGFNSPADRVPARLRRRVGNTPVTVQRVRPLAVEF